jgi:ABC-type branched-subunit amino acid transport system ATPase component
MWNLDVMENTRHAIINGAGKSTLLNVLVGKLIRTVGQPHGQSALGEAAPDQPDGHQPRVPNARKSLPI